MTDNTNHSDGCLMCAVRALTEGTPEAIWIPTEPGQMISGVVLRWGEIDTNYMGKVLFVDLWTGGYDRVRIVAGASGLRGALYRTEAQVGDTMTVRFDGTRTLEVGKYAGREIKTFSAEVQRGH